MTDKKLPETSSAMPSEKSSDICSFVFFASEVQNLDFSPRKLSRAVLIKESGQTLYPLNRDGFQTNKRKKEALFHCYKTLNQSLCFSETFSPFYFFLDTQAVFG